MPSAPDPPCRTDPRPPTAACEARAAARKAFERAFGQSPDGVAAAHGYVPLLAEHTDVLPGFGLLARLPSTVAVAARRAETWAVAGTAGAFERLARGILGEGKGWQLAVASAGPELDPEAWVGAAGAALLRATDTPAGGRHVAAAGGTVLGHPYGAAYPLASLDGGGVVLVDAGGDEALELETPPDLGLAVLDGGGEPIPAAARQERAARAERALAELRAGGFPDLTSLRRLEHRDLPAALGAVSPGLRPLLRHLVTEDRRVPRLVAALRRSDLQLFGALLLMSHASRREDEGVCPPAAETVVEAVGEADGVYGARLVGPGGAARLLVVGRTFLLPRFLDRTAERLARHVGAAPETHLLEPR